MFGDKIYGQILLTVAAENVNGGVENSGVGTRYRVSITGIGPDRGDDSQASSLVARSAVGPCSVMPHLQRVSVL